MAVAQLSSTPCVIGPDTCVRGTLAGEEDLVVEGRVEGSISLSAHLVVAPRGELEANVDVETVVVHGRVIGDIVASRGITIEKGARVEGKVAAPRVVIHDGAHFRGTVDMDVQLPDALAKSLAR